MLRSILLIHVAAVLLAGVSTAFASPGAQESAKQAGDAWESAPLSIPLNTPRPGLYTGGQPAAGDWAVIAGKGVTTVVDLRMPDELQGRDEAAEVRAAGMEYRQIPVDGLAGITAQNAAALAAVLAQAKGPVLVHCSSGNRVGGLLALTQAQAGASPEQAIEFGRSAGMKGTEAKVREVLGVPAGK